MVAHSCDLFEMAPAPPPTDGGGTSVRGPRPPARGGPPARPWRPDPLWQTPVCTECARWYEGTILAFCHFDKKTLPGVNHFCIVADPGSHSYKDCLVSLAWSWEAQQGVYPPWQELKPGRRVLDSEANLDSQMEALRLAHKFERVSAYRQIQGISHQIYHMVRKRHAIDAFQLPAGSNVRPVTQEEARVTVSDASGNHVFIRNRETGVAMRVLPVGLINVMLLLLQLDQGSIGAAGVAFLEYFLGWMVTAKFDKIHRAIRDLKLAAQAVPIFVKTKLWSAYLYAINKRPFGSGAHGTAKARLVDAFMEKVTIHSPVFVKYLPRLCREWLDLPSGTSLFQHVDHHFFGCVVLGLGLEEIPNLVLYTRD